jgi:hypothetical protein
MGIIGRDPPGNESDCVSQLFLVQFPTIKTKQKRMLEAPASVHYFYSWRQMTLRWQEDGQHNWEKNKICG